MNINFEYKLLKTILIMEKKWWWKHCKSLVFNDWIKEGGDIEHMKKSIE